jgi:hypothetical protein
MARRERGEQVAGEGPTKHLGAEILIALIAAIIALAIDIGKDFKREHDTYENTRAAIAAEAEGNDEVLTNTFNYAKFSLHPVFRDLNTKVVDSAVSNNTFVQKAAPELLRALVLYGNRMRQLNAHRAGLEKVYFAMPQDRTRMECYRKYFIVVLQDEALLGHDLSSTLTAKVRERPGEAASAMTAAVTAWEKKGPKPQYVPCPGA